MRNALARSEVWMFLVLIVLVNTAFILGIANGLLPLRAYNLGRFLLLGLVLVIVAAAFRGGEGLRALIRPMRVWRVHPGWYLLALFWAPLICAVTLLLKTLLTGGNAFVPTFEIVSRGSIMRTILIGSFIGEIVWVSYAIGRLSDRFTLLEASLITGLFWTLWWTPIVIFGKGVIPELPLGALFLNMLGIAAMCGFVYSRTGSGLVVLLLQVMVNSSLLVFPVLPTTGGVPTYWAFGVLYVTGVALVYLLFGARPLFNFGRTGPVLPG
jgi:membrane protease YdiL (CAAX protease family)